jgi:elongation factor G
MTLRASSISIVVTPNTPADREKLRRAVSALAAGDPPLHAIASPDGRETILSAVDMAHLERVVDRLKREFGVEAGVGKPSSTDPFP